MVKLSGNNLPTRQQSLNTQVNDAVTKNVPFNQIEAQPETSDVDKLFKIDVAAKYKNTDYIIETLKSGDSLYISRVLKKCLWLFHDEYSNIMSTDYLHQNIFPFMSIKMKKKLLTVASMNINNENRATQFYHYCEDNNLDNIADKFFVLTSEKFRLQKIQNGYLPYKDDDGDYLKYYISNSFKLLEAYLEGNKYRRYFALHKCSYLYNISDVQYLDLVERYVTMESKKGRQTNIFTLGLRVSKDIVIKHKQRILDKPVLYLSILNIGKLLKHSSRNDIEFYAPFLLPEDLDDVWRRNHRPILGQIINTVPENERYAFAKKIIADKYNKEFEMLKEFYEWKFYKLMTAEEREAWALRHIESGEEMHGSGKDYIWYQFLKFDKAFAEIKKCIYTCTDKTKRYAVLEVLVKSATNYQELEKVLQYFYERHVNESKSNKNSFLSTVVEEHNIYKVDDNCWAAFNKILHSIKAYDAKSDHKFRVVAMIYCILNDKAMPEVLIQYMETSLAMYSVKIHIKDEESKAKVYDYLYKFYIERILKFKPGSKEDKLVLVMHALLDLMAMFDKTKADIPDTIMEFINCDQDTYKYQKILKAACISECDLFRYLKKDSKLVLDKLPEVRDIIKDSWDFRIPCLLKKLRIYFSDDLAKDFIQLFNQSLTDATYMVGTAVHGLFQLYGEDDKISLLKKYAPESAKIDHDKIDSSLLRIQEAICRFVSYSRPPVPLANVLTYLRGDYVHFCLPMFNRYLTHLPVNVCLKFVESLINSPVSIQKHGLRLAFQCFSPDNLKNLFLQAWKNTKNVSIRCVIYKSLFEKASKESDKELCETLKTLTLDLKDTDDDDVFDLYRTHQLPVDFLGEYVEAFWKAVSLFKNNDDNINRKKYIIKIMNDKIQFMKIEMVKEIVNAHVKSMFDECSAEDSKKFQYLNEAKWELVSHYIEYHTRNETELSESIELTKFIVKECLKRWDSVACDVYVYRKMLREFIHDLNMFRFMPVADDDSYVPDTESFKNASPIFDVILSDLLAARPLHEIYLEVWALKIIITNRRVIKESCAKQQHGDGTAETETTTKKFGREVGKLIKEAVENNTYFPHFLEDIKDGLCRDATKIEVHRLARQVTVKTVDVELEVASGLLEVDSKETCLLALEMIPLDRKCNLALYESVYNALKAKADTEIQCCMYKKFNGDCKRRRLE